MPKKIDKLQMLLNQETELAAAIKAEKKQQAKQAAALHAERCRIVGAAVIAAMENNKALGQQLAPIIDKATTSPTERRTLDLPPHKKEKAASPSVAATEKNESP